MAIKGNKGELSELYTFFKLLADGKLYCGDGKLNRYDDRFYPILDVFRDDSLDRNSYHVQHAKKSILVAGETFTIEVPQHRFQEEAGLLLDLIKTKEDNPDFTSIEEFMELIDCHSVKAKSSDKADIRIVIHNLHTGSKPELGYSIKSKLGAPSTLINANKNGTNFIYSVGDMSDEQIMFFNGMDKFKDKFHYLKSIEVPVSFYGVANSVLHNNLTLLDLGMERIIGDCLLGYYSGVGRTIDELTRRVSLSDPLNIMHGTGQPMYAYKVKQFLLAFALGMTASSPWYGSFNANGGYIIVKENGDVICYHFFDRNDLEDYLFYNTRFESPSTGRHEYGYIYRDGKHCYIKLNLQVRFM